VGFAGLVVLALVAGGTYIYFFSGMRSAPRALGLTSTPGVTTTPASGSPSASPTATTAGLAGTYTVASGSLAGFRVKELFAGQSSQHQAVVRTSTVSGDLTVTGDSSGYEVSSITVTAGLADLHSVDTVAGRDVSQRDTIVARQIDVQSFPTATFNASSISVPGTVTGSQVALSVPGNLTIHGVTKSVTVTAQAQVVGGKIEIAGSVSINMNDYGVSPPQVGFVTVDSAVTIEFDIFLTKPA
jgi:polyisoprenoid-binding protein YceI